MDHGYMALLRTGQNIGLCSLPEIWHLAADASLPIVMRISEVVAVLVIQCCPFHAASREDPDQAACRCHACSACDACNLLWMPLFNACGP